MQLSTTFIPSRNFVYSLQCSAVDIQTATASQPAVGWYHPMLAHFWLFFHRQWKGQLLLLSELYYNNDDRRRSKHDFKIKHFEINWLRNIWTEMSNLLVLFSTWVSDWQTWILLRQLKATQVYLFPILVWMVVDHNLTLF